jgi:fluoride exporter
MLLYVAIGSALGGVARYLLGGLVQRIFETTFPVGTLLINISGSLLLGAIMGYAMDTPTLSPNLRAFLTIGLCGGYTTFSTFSYETVSLLNDGEWTRAGFYVVASVALALISTLLGFALARQAISWR